MQSCNLSRWLISKDDGQNKKCIAEKELLRAQNKEKDEQVKEEMKKTIDLNSMIKQSKKRKNHGKSKKRKKMRRDVGSLQEF